jgi:predicted metal-dependent hydrolase
MQALRQLFAGRAASAPDPEPLEIKLGDTIVRVRMKRHATARRMLLRLARDGKSFTLTLPKRQSLASARQFLAQSSTWMANTLAHRGSKQADDAAGIPLRGEMLSLTFTGASRGVVERDDASACLKVPGSPEHRARRLKDWLKQQAEADLRRASLHYAACMDTRFNRLTVRDQKSRWGSCSADGALSYSWRLVLAPPFVLDYVAAHEVAHLREMNHGPRFWRLVLTHCPHTRQAQGWLKANGSRLHHVLS